MCFEPNPLHHTLHLKGLEAKFLGQKFDHSKPQLTGWRAERQITDISANNADKTSAPNASPAPVILKTSRFAAVLRNFLGARAVG